MSDGKGIEALVPLSAITRPLDTPVDEAKVCSLMATLRDPATAGDVPPITLLWLTGDEGGQAGQRLHMCPRAATECCTWRKRAARRDRVYAARLRCLTSVLSIATPPVRICADLASQRAAHSVRCMCMTCDFGGAQTCRMHRHDGAPWT